jgi:hypothetical protein
MTWDSAVSDDVRIETRAGAVPAIRSAPDQLLSSPPRSEPPLVFRLFSFSGK